MTNLAVRILLVIVGMSLGSRVYAQTPQLLDEFGASCKSISMGQAFTAVADDFAAAYYNPAGLSQITSPYETTFGYFYAKPMAKATFLEGRNIGSNIVEQPSSHGAIIGMASSLDVPGLTAPFPWLRPLSFGMVFWLNLPVMLQYHVGPEDYRPHFLRYDKGFAIMSMAISLSYEITPWLSMGAGVFPSQQVSSKQEVFMALNDSNIIEQIPPYVRLFELDEVIGSRLSLWQEARWTVAPIAGLLLKLPIKSFRDKVSLGVSYRGENIARHVKGPLTVTIGFENEATGEPIGTEAIRLYFKFVDFYMLGYVGYQPAQVTAALAFKNLFPPLKGLAFSFDLTWKDYSEFIDNYKETPIPPLEDTYVYRTGIEYGVDPGFSIPLLNKISHIALRGGYYFEPTPVANMDKAHSHNIYDTDMDVVSGGLQVDFTSRQGRLYHSLEAYYQDSVPLLNCRTCSPTFFAQP